MLNPSARTRTSSSATLPPAPSYRILPSNAGNTAGGQSGLYGQLVTLQHQHLDSAIFDARLDVHDDLSTQNTNDQRPTGGVPASGLSPAETIVGTTIVPIVTGNSSLASAGSTGSSSTLEAGQTAAITTAQGVTLSYVSDGGRDQVLTNVSGSFTAQPNLLEPLAAGPAGDRAPRAAGHHPQGQFHRRAGGSITSTR